MNAITLIGLDLAKLAFQVHGVDCAGQAVLKKRLTRAKVVEFFAQREPCVVAMEACGSAHHWARLLASFGHNTKLIPPQYLGLPWQYFTAMAA
jgi:transposase